MKMIEKQKEIKYKIKITKNSRTKFSADKIGNQQTKNIIVKINLLCKHN